MTFYTAIVLMAALLVMIRFGETAQTQTIRHCSIKAPTTSTLAGGTTRFTGEAAMTSSWVVPGTMLFTETAVVLRVHTKATIQSSVVMKTMSSLATAEMTI